MKTLYRVQLRGDKDESVKTSLCTDLEDAKAIEARWIRELTIKGYKVDETKVSSVCGDFNKVIYLYNGISLCTICTDNYLFLSDGKIYGVVE